MAYFMLRTVYSNRLANIRATLLAEITCTCYDGAGILEHKAKIHSLHMKLTKAGNPIPYSMYFNFLINTLLEEFGELVDMVNYDLDTVEEEVISHICQMEIRSLHTENEGMAFATQKRAHVAGTPYNVQGTVKNSERRSNTCSVDVSISESITIGPGIA